MLGFHSSQASQVLHTPFHSSGKSNGCTYFSAVDPEIVDTPYTTMCAPWHPNLKKGHTCYAYSTARDTTAAVVTLLHTAGTPYPPCIIQVRKCFFSNFFFVLRRIWRRRQNVVNELLSIGNNVRTKCLSPLRTRYPHHPHRLLCVGCGNVKMFILAVGGTLQRTYACDQ